jgi:hypothetical protein
MAFRMTRPTIQGTEYHKASVLKAKAETVAQTRTAADPTLVATGSELGRSYIPKAIDFTIKPTEIKIPEGDGKKKEPIVVEEETKVEPKVEATKLDAQTIRQLPTKAAEEELLKTTGSAANVSYQQDRFEKAAEKFGYDISTPEGYKEAEEAMEYNDRTDTWTNPRISVGSLEITDPEEVAKNNADTQAQIDAREALKLQKAKEKAEALQLKKDQEAKELEEKNEAIREQNKAIVEAKEFYGITGDGKLTRSKLEEYQNMRILQAENEAKYQQNPIEIEEERSREWNEAPPGQETVSNRSDLQKGGKIMDVDSNIIPDFIQKPTQVEPGVQPTATTTSQTTQNVTTTKPKLSDFKDGKNAFGGHMSKNQAYNEAMRKWRRENPNPIQMRDDAIYKNAIKDGVVQRNMIKSGYKPLD